MDLVTVAYTNHRGETSERLIRPIRIFFGSTAWHSESQWMMEVFDLHKQATRDYALAGFNFSTWRKVNSKPGA